METIIKDVAHNFDLSGLKIGQSFFGCPQCGLQLKPDEICGSRCDCGGEMYRFTVTENDFLNMGKVAVTEWYSIQVSDKRNGWGQLTNQRFWDIQYARLVKKQEEKLIEKAKKYKERKPEKFVLRSDILSVRIVKNTLKQEVIE